MNKYSSVSLVDGTANGWDFPSYCGNPFVSPCSAGSGSAAMGANGRVTLTGTLPKGFRVTGASIDLSQLLHQPAHLPQLVDSGPGLQATGPLQLSVHTGPSRVNRASAGRPSGQLSLAPGTAGQRRFSLSVSGVRVGVPAACRQLAASDALGTPSVTLSTVFSLEIHGRSRKVAVSSVWRCVRSRAGVITGLAPAVARRVAQRRGLAVSLAGPRVVTAGATLSYAVRVSNRRRGPRNRLVSSLWHIVVQGRLTPFRRTDRLGTRTARRVHSWELRELRRGRSRVLRFIVHVPRSAAGRVCVAALASADSARASGERLCARVIAPLTGGLG